MRIGEYKIKPILLYLPDEEIWRQEHAEMKEYLDQQGIWDYEEVAGVHAKKWGVQGRHIYLLDNRPEEQFYIGDNKVGGFISHYILYCVMHVMNEHSHFMVMEGDMRFTHPEWGAILEQALDDVPADFDFLFVGSCCAADKEPVHVRGDVYHFPWRGEDKWNWYPQCGHCYIVAKKCMPLLIATQRDTANPVDVSLIRFAFPKLNIYAILPRLADQGIKTFLPV